MRDIRHSFKPLGIFAILLISSGHGAWSDDPISPAERTRMAREADRLHSEGLRLFRRRATTGQWSRFGPLAVSARRPIPRRNTRTGPSNRALCTLDLGSALSRVGRPDLAIAEFRTAIRMLESLRGTYPESTSDLCEALNNYGVALLKLGRPDEAIPALEKALQTDEGVPPPASATVPTGRLENLATAYIMADQGAKARPLLLRILQLRQSAAPNTRGVSSELVRTLHTIGNSFQSERLPYDARSYHEQAFDMCRKLHPDGKHEEWAISLNYMAESHLILGRPDLALNLAKEARPILESLYPRGHPELAKCLDKIATSAALLGHPAEAIPLAEGHRTSTNRSILPACSRVVIRSSSSA